MRSRLLVLAAASVLSLSLTACGGSDGKITVAGPAQQTDETTGTVAPDPSSDPTDETATADTIFDQSDMPDFSATEECQQVGEAFTNLSSSAMTMTADEAQSALNDAIAQFPEEIRGVFQTLIDAYTSMGQGDMDAMSSQEFLDANDKITTYITEVCTPGG